MASPAEADREADALFVRLLREVRAGRGMTQAEVARSMGVSRSVVAFVESHRRRLSPDDLPQWAAALGVDAAQLLQLRMACFGYQLDEDRNWLFYQLASDPAFEDNPDDPAYGIIVTLAELTNTLASDKRVEPYLVAYGGNLDSKFPGDGLRLLADEHGREFAVVGVTLPMEPLLGDPNEPDGQVAPQQGTRADLDELLAQATDAQIALTSAFLRGLYAQARSRRPSAARE